MRLILIKKKNVRNHFDADLQISYLEKPSFKQCDISLTWDFYQTQTVCEKLPPDSYLCLCMVMFVIF